MVVCDLAETLGAEALSGHVQYKLAAYCRRPAKERFALTLSGDAARRELRRSRWLKMRERIQAIVRQEISGAASSESTEE